MLFFVFALRGNNDPRRANYFIGNLMTHRWLGAEDIEKFRNVCTGSFLINSSPKSVKKNIEWDYAANIIFFS
jgi:hypothetical protein